MKQGWTYKKLGEVTTTINGLWTGKKPPFINVAVIRNTNFTKDCKLDMTNVAYLDVEQKQYNSRKLLPGDIIIEKSGGSDKQPVGRPVLFDISEGEYSFSNFTSTLRINNADEIIPQFLHCALYSAYLRGETFKLQSKTTGIHNLDFKGYNRLPIPIPSLSEQQSVVAELDKINELISLKKTQLSDIDKLAQNVFYEMFGHPLTNEKEWKTKKYGECFTIGAGGTPSKSNPLYWDNGNIPWIGSNMCQNCIITETDGKYITSEGLKNSSAKMLDPGTVLVALVGATIGKVALLRTCTSTNQNIAFIKVNENKLFCPEFVYYHLMNQYDEFMLIGNGDFKMANQAFIKSLTIMMPPISLQQEFAKRLKMIEQQKLLINSAVENLETLLASRMQYWFG